MKKVNFEVFKENMELLDEDYIESNKACIPDHFVKLGLTDSTIIELSKNKYLVLSVDFPLVGYLAKNNIDAINFNHIRTYHWN